MTTFSARILLAILFAPVVLLLMVLWIGRIDVSQSPRRHAAVTFVDRNGLVLGTVLPADSQHAVFVSLDRVSPVFLRAVVAAEDARFYRHAGIDIAAVARSVRQLVESGHAVSGASTITMQVARMMYGIPSSTRGKLREMWLASRIEAGSTKLQILEAYVNRVPMGGNITGVEAAAQSYFGVPAADLDLAQASLLAALPNDPERLSPRTHLREALQRRRYVLARMLQTGAIAPEQAAQAAREELHLIPTSRGVYAGAHLLFALASQVPAETARVQTTLDRPLQQFVETQMRALLAALAGRNVHQGAALVVDNRTGEVLAYVGSPDYFDDANAGRNDGVRALRQPGSALKPFLYELALERGVIASNTILADVPATYAIPGGGLYEPADYSNAYAGPVRVRVALADSLNVPAVRVLSQLGTEQFLNRLHALGFAHLTKPPQFYGLGLTLGGGEVSLWELTHAYVTLARHGAAIPLRTMQNDASGSADPIGSAPLWLLVTDMLADPHARARSFGTSSILDLPFPAAVKTGTSSDFRDTWTVGFSTDYTVGVWVGNFNGQPMRHVSGVTGAAPLWNRIMARMHESREPGAFSAPAGMVRRPICATTGRRPARDCPARVWEYLFPSQFAAYASARPAAYPRSYDEWLAAQHLVAQTGSDVRILFPHSGDTFVLAKTDDTVQVAPLQAIRFEVRTFARAPVTWRLNGRALRSTGGSTLMWRLAPGTWKLDARTASRSDSVWFRVVRARPHERRGFSL